MSKVMETAQSYWDTRSDLFANYYKKPSLFDSIFRKGVFQRQAVALKACKEIPGARVLDIGSGPGIISVSLIKNAGAAHITGIDFAPQMIEYAEKTAAAENVKDKCTFVSGDILTHDFGTQEFDYSIALGVFDYVQDAEKLIKRMAALSSKSFMASWPENGLRMSLRRYRYTCPVYHYSAKDILELHKRAGIPESKVELINIGGGLASVARK